MAAIFVTDWDEMSILNRGPSIKASCKMLLYLAKNFQRRFFRNQSTRNKNCLQPPCLLTDPNEIINLKWGPSIDASYQVHLAKRFQSRRFYVTDQPETRIAYGCHVC
jgi:hypothetical protein